MNGSTLRPCGSACEVLAPVLLGVPLWPSRLRRRDSADRCAHSAPAARRTVPTPVVTLLIALPMLWRMVSTTSNRPCANACAKRLLGEHALGHVAEDRSRRPWSPPEIVQQRSPAHPDVHAVRNSSRLRMNISTSSDRLTPAEAAHERQILHSAWASPGRDRRDRSVFDPLLRSRESAIMSTADDVLRRWD